MSPLDLLTILGAAGGFAVLDLLRRLLTDRVAVVPLLLALVAGALPIFALWTVLSWPIEVAPGYVLPGVGSALVNVAANLGFLHAMRLSGLGATIPLLSLTPVFASLLSIPLLGQLPTDRQWLGVLLVVGGALQLQAAGGETGEGSRGLGSWRRLSPRVLLRERGGLWMMLVALLWSLTLPLDKLAIDASAPPFHGLILHIGVLLGALPLLAFGENRKGLTEVRANLPLIALAVLCGAAALGLQLLALESVLAGLVETLKRGLGSVAALVFGARFFGESLDRWKVVGVAMMALGVAAILI